MLERSPDGGTGWARENINLPRVYSFALQFIKIMDIGYECESFTHMNSRCKMRKSCDILLFVFGFWLLFHYSWGSTSFQAHAVVFEVGPGKKFDQISKVPFDALNPGDVVKIYYRKKPYNEKMALIIVSATKKQLCENM